MILGGSSTRSPWHKSIVAAGTVGTGRVARARPDGYTLAMGQVGTHVIDGATFAALQYDVVSDFEPVALIATTPFLLLARKTMPAEALTA